jgi:AcrR family transcriptional regulator
MVKGKTLQAEKKEWTRREVLNAAKRLFFQKGFIHTSIEEIAREARISKGTIYLHFQSKDELYLSLMVPALQELGRLFKNLEGDLSAGRLSDGKAVVLGFFEIFKDIYEYDPDGIRIIQAFQQGDLISKMTGEPRGEVNRLARRNFNLGRSILTQAIRLKLIPKVNPVKMIDIFWATFVGIVQLEESKLRATGKDHLRSTLKYAFLKMADPLRPDRSGSQ